MTPAHDEPTTQPDLSRLPQVDAVVHSVDAERALATYGRRALTEAVRRILGEAREAARERGVPLPRQDEIVERAEADLAERRRGRLQRVINATGVVLHTNLGRAPLSGAARQAVNDAAGYTTLEYDLAEGRRGSRTEHVGRLAAEACGTEAATVVNNGAAALVLVLAALSTGKETIVSRGELIEIGGSFRLPDIMGVSGAKLREVGTTNRTRATDYQAALGDDTALLLKVHQSNYRVVGFSETPEPSELAEIAERGGVPFVYDTGSGLLRDHEGALSDEPSVAGAIAAGADLVIFSGDKLLGGPQAGIIAGRSDLVLRCSRHPLARALRIDKLQRAALEATLESHLRSDLPMDVPSWAMVESDIEELHERARWVAEHVGGDVGYQPMASLIGGGSLPGLDLGSWGLVIPDTDPDGVAGRLRRGDPAVIGRVEAGHVVLDLRTVAPAQDRELVELIRAALGG